MKEEIWRDIQGYTGLYEVSSMGRVRTVKSGLIRKQTLHWKGYYCVTLRKPVQHCKTYRTHRLVAVAFLDNPSMYPQVNHKDGNKLNNCVENLEWCNNSMNQLHSVKNGLRVMPSGVDAPKVVLVLHKDYGIYCTISEAAKIEGMDNTTLGRHIRSTSKSTKYIMAQ